MSRALAPEGRFSLQLFDTSSGFLDSFLEATADPSTALGMTVLLGGGRAAKRGLWTLAVADPAEQFGQRGALAIHEDADSIDARGEPEDAPGGERQQDYGDRNLPHWHFRKAHARDHDVGRGEREE